MALRGSGATHGMSRTTTPPPLGDFSLVGWFFPVTFAHGVSVFFSYATDENPAKVIYVTTAGLLSVYDGADVVTGLTLSLNTWVHIGLTFDGANVRGYLNGALNITNASVTLGGDTLWVGTDASPSWLNGRYDAIKIWDVALPEQAIAREMRQVRPVRTANLNTFTSCRSLEEAPINYAGAHGLWTVGSGMAQEAGPPVPWELPRRRPVARAPAVPVSVAGDEGFVWYRALTG